MPIRELPNGLVTPLHAVHRPRSPWTGIGGHLAQEPVVTIARNRRSPWPGAGTLALFPGCRLTAVHAYDIGFTGVAGSGSAIADYETRSQADIDALIATARSAFQERTGAAPPEVRTYFAHGSTDHVMTSFIERDSTNLVVIGTHGRTGLRRAVIGSVAARLLNTLPIDVLAIHPDT